MTGLDRASPVRAETPYGPVEGHVVPVALTGADGPSSVLEFLAVPYAAPPTRERRLAPASSPTPWVDVRPAHAPGPAAAQPTPPPGASATSEDCLHLNIWTPAIDDTPRPIVVWLHGGGFTAGTALTPVTNGARLAARHDIVVVSINYRLGALGWLHLDHLGPQWTGSANLGLTDQLAALAWVRDAISGFGGDPDRVMVAGQSAGGCSIAALVRSPRAGGSFHAAAIHSGPAAWIRPPDQAADVADRVLAHAGVDTPEALRDLDIAALMEAQRLATRDLTAAQIATPRGAPRHWLPFGPVSDGIIVAGTDGVPAGRPGRPRDVALILGTTRNEWCAFSSRAAPTTSTDRIEAVVSTVADPAAVLAPYRARLGDDADAITNDVHTDRLFRIPTIQMADTHVAEGAEGARTWVYEFRYPSPNPRYASGHSLDLPFLFDALDLPEAQIFVGDDAPRSLSVEMGHAWAALARNGRPEFVDGQPWPSYGDARPTVILDDPVSVESDPRSEERRAWPTVL